MGFYKVENSSYKFSTTGMPGSHRRDRRGRLRPAEPPSLPSQARRPKAAPMLRRGLGSVDYILRSALEDITLIDRFTVRYRVAESPRLFFLYEAVPSFDFYPWCSSSSVLSLKICFYWPNQLFQPDLFHLLALPYASVLYSYSICGSQGIASWDWYYFEGFFIKWYQCVWHVSWWFKKCLIAYYCELLYLFYAIT